VTIWQKIKDRVWWLRPKFKPGVRILRQGEARARHHYANATGNQGARIRTDSGNSKLVGWKLFYTDGSTASSMSTKFNDAPQLGVQALIKYYRRKLGGYSREVQNGQDFYLLYPEIAEQLSMSDQVKVGKAITNAAFDEIMAEVYGDKEVITRMI
jgi:hypothetical protein